MRVENLAARSHFDREHYALVLRMRANREDLPLASEPVSRYTDKAVQPGWLAQLRDVLCFLAALICVCAALAMAAT